MLVALLFIIAPTFQLFSQEQLGRPLITNYNYQEYDAGPVNWWGLEDEDGIKRPRCITV